MFKTINSSIQRTSIGLYRLNCLSMRREIVTDLLGLIEAFCLYAGLSMLAFTVFSKINGQVISFYNLSCFVAAFVGINSISQLCSDYGLGQFSASLRNSQKLFYYVTPGNTFLKVCFMKIPLPQIILAAISSLIYIGLSQFYFRVFFLKALLVIILGAIVSTSVELVFGLSVLVFAPDLHNTFQNPLGRLMSRPLHVIAPQAPLLAFAWMYVTPTYFMSGFASQTGTGLQNVISVGSGILLSLVWIFIMFTIAKIFLIWILRTTA